MEDSNVKIFPREKNKNKDSSLVSFFIPKRNSLRTR